MSLNKDSLAYLCVALLLVTSVASLAALPSIANAQDDEIILEGTDYNSTSSIQYPENLPVVDITRIVVEYGDFATTHDVHGPDGLPSPSLSRIIVEYADISLQVDVQPPQGLPQPDSSRIIIEYADYARIFDVSIYLGPQPMGKNDTQPPEIGILSRIPADPEVPEYQEVTIIADITDADGGVKNGTLQYSINNGTEWLAVPMTLNLSGYKNSLSVSYYGVIPGQTNCTWVHFRVVAYDYAWNTASRDGESPYCPYHVVPEFPSITLMLVLAISSLFATALAKNMHHRRSRINS
jgi:hypothetical protein